MADYAPLGITDIANLALMEVGQQPIDSIDNVNGNAPAACRAAFWQTVREVGRAHNWNCLKKRVKLVQLTFPDAPAQDVTSLGWPGCHPSTPPPYWLANTAYTGGTLVTYGEAIYYCLMAYTSSTNFINDMTGGYWAQIYSSFYAGNGQGADNNLYEWKYGYALPSDYLLLTELNGQNCRFGRGVGSLYEIFINQVKNGDDSISSASALFCNTGYADIKYTALITDPTVWDSLFIGAVSILLASKISTRLRGDDGAMSSQLRNRYLTDILPNARLKDAGEAKLFRYDPTAESNFLRSRYGSTAG
jgi:hypothetical protein